MPTTPVYGLPYEALSNQPGITLTGGELGTEDILAEAVETELARVDSDIAAAEQATTDLETDWEARGAKVIDKITSGSGTNTTEFTNIPQTYTALQIIWRGTSDGSGDIDGLAVRFNGDSGSNYNWVSFRSTSTSSTSVTISATTSLWCGLVGTGRGAGSIWIPSYATTAGKMAHGTTTAVASDFTTVYGGILGGRWGSSAAITSVRMWPASQLWSANPELILIGWP